MCGFHFYISAGSFIYLLDNQFIHLSHFSEFFMSFISLGSCSLLVHLFFLSVLPFYFMSFRFISFISFRSLFHSISAQSRPVHSSCIHSFPFRSFPFHSCHSLHSIPVVPFHPLHSIPFHIIPFHSISFHSVPYYSVPFHSIHLHSISLLSVHLIPVHSCHVGSFHVISFHVLDSFIPLIFIHLFSCHFTGTFKNNIASSINTPHNLNLSWFLGFRKIPTRCWFRSSPPWHGYALLLLWHHNDIIGAVASLTFNKTRETNEPECRPRNVNRCNGKQNQL